MDLFGGRIMQVAHVVPDIERAMAEWTRVLGIGPFFYFRQFPVIDAQYRGSPLVLDARLAVAYSGSTCFELIQPSPSCAALFSEGMGGRVQGLHHFGVATSTFDEDVARSEQSGAPLVASCTVAIGARAAFVDTTASLGSLLELIEVTPDVEGFFGMVRAASIDWDGSNPVRSMLP